MFVHGYCRAYQGNIFLGSVTYLDSSDDYRPPLSPQSPSPSIQSASRAVPAPPLPGKGSSCSGIYHCPQSCPGTTLSDPHMEGIKAPSGGYGNSINLEASCPTGASTSYNNSHHMFVPRSARSTCNLLTRNHFYHQ